MVPKFYNVPSYKLYKTFIKHFKIYSSLGKKMYDLRLYKYAIEIFFLDS